MIEDVVPCRSGGLRYAVLTGDGGLRVLVRPTAGQLRECGSQGWVLLRAIGSQPDAWGVLQETLRRAIPDTDEGAESGDRGNGLDPIDPDNDWSYDSCTD